LHLRSDHPHGAFIRLLQETDKVPRPAAASWSASSIFSLAPIDTISSVIPEQRHPHGAHTSQLLAPSLGMLSDVVRRPPGCALPPLLIGWSQRAPSAVWERSRCSPHQSVVSLPPKRRAPHLRRKGTSLVAQLEEAIARQEVEGGRRGRDGLHRRRHRGASARTCRARGAGEGGVDGVGAGTA
jgi:hypothetical protein